MSDGSATPAADLAGFITRLGSDLVALDTELAPIPLTTRWSLKWPRWHMPDAEDRERDARTLTGLLAAGIISPLTAVKSVADVYDIADVAAEMARISNEEHP